MIHEMGQSAFKTPTDIKDGDIIIGRNFSQLAPDTDIFAGLSNLEFVDCNLVNVKPVATCTTIGCNTAINEYTLDGNGDVIACVNRGKSVWSEMTESRKSEILESPDIKNIRVKRKYGIANTILKKK